MHIADVPQKKIFDPTPSLQTVTVALVLPFRLCAPNSGSGWVGLADRNPSNCKDDLATGLCGIHLVVVFRFARFISCLCECLALGIRLDFPATLPKNTRCVAVCVPFEGEEWIVVNGPLLVIVPRWLVRVVRACGPAV